MSSSSSDGSIRISPYRFRIGGNATVRRVSGAVTLSHNLWCGDSVSDIVSNGRSGDAAASAARWRRALVSLRMVWTSRKTALGKRWRKSVYPLPGVPFLSKNMVVAMCMASPRMFCRSVVRESMNYLSPNIDPVGSAVLDGMVEPRILVSIAFAVAIASEVGEWASIAT